MDIRKCNSKYVIGTIWIFKTIAFASMPRRELVPLLNCTLKVMLNNTRDLQIREQLKYVDWLVVESVYDWSMNCSLNWCLQYGTIIGNNPTLMSVKLRFSTMKGVAFRVFSLLFRTVKTFALKWTIWRNTIGN